MNLPLAPLVALVTGLLAAAGVVLFPEWRLERLVLDSGIAAIVPAAEPPLGMTARLILALGVAGVTALFGWFAAFLLLGARGVSIGRHGDADAGDAIEQVPTIRRADAHPDAPPRPPLRANRDLGMPFLEVTAKLRSGAEAESESDSPAPAPAESPREAEDESPAVATHALFERHDPVRVPNESDLPLDLDQPMASYDPGAIRDDPLPPPSPILPMRRPSRPAVYDKSERFETFELTPHVRTPQPPPIPAPAPSEPAITRPETDASIHALLDRLEKGAVRRGIAVGAEAGSNDTGDHGLEEALSTLRNLARRA
jgi:hypothetical protein